MFNLFDILLCFLCNRYLLYDAGLFGGDAISVGFTSTFIIEPKYSAPVSKCGEVLLTFGCLYFNNYSPHKSVQALQYCVAYSSNTDKFFFDATIRNVVFPFLFNLLFTRICV